MTNSTRHLRAKTHRCRARCSKCLLVKTKILSRSPSQARVPAERANYPGFDNVLAATRLGTAGYSNNVP
ncbi:hypothetical protein SERLA73DRAFT_181680 [Serpula lacrymans var. lacrymans S7.3]|uniref:Uncharacterized protein n=2 Tax=Serpula lacrymans var. lacrymans TaxID=341189 RepID=F8PYH7_SERL3|nr:uncharacterized protein SERLADRAFT_467992 [Serpula lacrymans var. lacrymans S7.9]EGN98940.1 hypothetical protein SERLA73DRAFT_181680 [Serpula lacrymans var. lacrymans S7.3]EGO24530.1 hypothetical protein SERLADRAFT_467992 [Serpula lacrymans var. lacrymans S7.9]